MNRLYYGDCLTILKDIIPAESVDLIYLDPPFNSNREYNYIYKDETGRPLPDQVEAFNDTWSLDEDRLRRIREMPKLLLNEGIDSEIAIFWDVWMNALRNTNPKLLAYLSYMAERLLYLRRVLKPSGTIWLHCDPTASHYLKIFMDGTFGHNNFRNEIVWFHPDTPGRPKRDFSRKHDVIFRYVKDNKLYKFNAKAVKVPIKEASKKRYEYSRTLGGKDYLGGEGAKKGKIPESVWKIPSVKGNSKEKIGVTQKPLPLLDRIIKSSSDKGDIVLDPFCGCGTTMEAAHRLDRNWIGIDIAIHAVKRVARKRLREKLHLVDGEDFEIDGVPRNFEGALDLWKRDPYHFQKWAVEQVDGFVTKKRTGDGGIDGHLYFDVDQKFKKRQIESMILEVKGGKNVSIQDLRSLKGVLDTCDSLMAGLIVLHPLRPQMRKNFSQFIGDAGDVRINNRLFAKLQVLTVDEILDGERFETPWAFGATGERPIV